MSNNSLFTIAIPTYNRSRHLNVCLSNICKQLPGFEDLVEVIVSDNHSPDDTTEVVEGYIKKGFPVRYIKNENNIGPDLNFLQCFKQASGKYVLILGDDDVLLDGALKKMIAVLRTEEYGVVHVKSYGFSKDVDLEKPKRKIRQARTIIYDEVDQFVDAVNYWFTFISGNIVNKSLIKDTDDLESSLGTQLNQFGWIFPAFLRSKKNVVMNEYLVAANNTAPSDVYVSLKVFSTNLNKVMRSFVKDGLSEEAISIINRHLLLTFFPFSVIGSQFKKGAFDREACLAELRPIYKGYFLFWLYIIPLLKLPLPLAKVWLFLIRATNKLKSFI